jgi:hypothetical protein
MIDRRHVLWLGVTASVLGLLEGRARSDHLEQSSSSSGLVPEPKRELTPVQSEPEAATLEIFDQLVKWIKSSRPIRSDDKKPAELGFVFSQLALGIMIDPRDYMGAWSPASGGSIQGTAISPVPDSKYSGATDAAFKTAMLVDRIIMVSEGDTYLEYPGGGRKLSVAYEGILNGIQPLQAPPIAPEVQKRLDEARKVLYVPDKDGDLLIESKLYKVYKKNAKAYQQAVADFGKAQAEALTDRAKAQAWPVSSRALRQVVDEAWDTWKTEGAERIEAALDTIESVGVSMEPRLIAKARKNFNLQAACPVSVNVPYVYCAPAEWADPMNGEGWTSLQIKRNSYSRHLGQDNHLISSFSKNTSSSSTSVAGRGSYMGFGASAGYQTADAHESDDPTTDRKLSSLFKNTAKNLTISLEYGIVDIIRPWLMVDLFYMKNWYLVNYKRNAISDGTISGQAYSTDSLLPMLPEHFLVVRNLKISSLEWGSDGETLRQLFGDEGGAWDRSSSGFTAGASYGFGPFSISANVSPAQAKEGVSRYGKYTRTERQDYEGHFDGTTLEIKGAQIVAWLSTIVPPCPPLDDPRIGKTTRPGAAAAPAPLQRRPSSNRTRGTTGPDSR